MKVKNIILMMAVALCITGCGNGGSNSGTQDTTTEDAPKTTASTETEAASTADPESVYRYEEVEGGVSILSCTDESADIVIPDTLGGQPVVEIDSFAFAGRDMQSVTVPDTVTYIGEAAFESCDSLETITLGSGLKELGYGVFNNCVSLTRLELPDGIEKVGGSVINNNDIITEIVVPASLTDFSDSILFLADYCPNAVVITPAGSATEQHCIDNDIPYQNP